MKLINPKNVSKWMSVAVALALLASLPGQAIAADGNADEIMNLAKAQWASQDGGQPASVSMATVADDYTEFNAIMPTRVDGKAMAAKFSDAQDKSGEKGLVSEMQNPKVQFYGDTAILTYNFAGLTKSADGKVKPNTAKSTRVYAKQNGKWMLVHANFAPVVAPSN